MDIAPGEQAINIIREAEDLETINADIEIERPRDEKIDIEIHDIVRCFPQNIANIVASYKDWSRQWEI